MKTTTINGDLNVAYETKVLLIALSKIVCRADSVKEVYKAIKDMANAEGVLLKSYDEAKSELEESQSAD